MKAGPTLRALLLIGLFISTLFMDPAAGSEQRRLPLKVLDPPAKRMRGLWVNRAFVTDGGKNLLIKGVFARKGLELRHNGTVLLPAIDSEDRREYQFRIPHEVKDYILELEVRNVSNDKLMSDSFGIVDDQFDKKQEAASEPTSEAGTTVPEAAAAVLAPMPVQVPSEESDQKDTEENEEESTLESTSAGEDKGEPTPEPETLANEVMPAASMGRSVGDPCDCSATVSEMALSLPTERQWTVGLELGMSSLKGTDIATKKTATLVSPTDMSLSFAYHQTFFDKIRTRFSYEFWMMNRLQPDGGWELKNGNVFLDRPRVAGIYRVWPNLYFYPGLSYGEFENVQISNNVITLTKSREISLDFGLTYFLYTFDPIKLGLVVDGSSLAFIDGGSRLKLGVTAEGVGELKPYNVSFSYNEDSVSHNSAKQSTTRFSLVFGYTGGF